MHVEVGIVHKLGTLIWLFRKGCAYMVQTETLNANAKRKTDRLPTNTGKVFIETENAYLLVVSALEYILNSFNKHIPTPMQLVQFTILYVGFLFVLYGWQT
jgi:hypothetical protein